VGGSSKKQTVGYRYYLGMHMVLCHGPVDKLKEIIIGDKTAWVGDADASPITIDEPSLFGGDSGEGGVSGTVDLLWGGPTQAVNDYLLTQVGGSETLPAPGALSDAQKQIFISIGALDETGAAWSAFATNASVPAFRGVTSAVLRQCYLGNNPYIKPWAFKAQRIFKDSDGGVQWYESKAGIGAGRFEGFPIGSAGWDYQYSSGTNIPASPETFPAPTNNWISNGIAPFGNESLITPEIFPNAIMTHWPHQNYLWLRKEIEIPRVAANLALFITVENACFIYFDGIYQGAVNPTNEQIPSNEDAYFELSGDFSIGTHTLVIYCLDEPENFGVTGDGTYFDASLAGWEQLDMNPAHIIRECLTSQVWGLGYQEADIDEGSFISAADTLFAEEFGLSMLWDKSASIEDFIGEVLRHIDATLFIDRTTGKFVLKLIRDDYDEESLITLGDADIIKVDDYRRSTIDELTNSITVVYEDWQTAENATVSEQDIALVQMQGGVVAKKIDYPGISNASLARRAVRRDLHALSSPNLSCTIYATRKAASLNIGDVFKFEWSDYHVGAIIMRVVGMAFGDGRSNQVKIECTQDVFSLASIDDVSSGSIEVFTDTNQAPQNVTNLLLIEAPYYELVQINGQSSVDDQLAVEPTAGLFLTTAVKPNYAINAALWVDAGTGYEEVAVLVDFCPSAILSADIGPMSTVIPITNGDDLSSIVVGSHAQINDELVRIDGVTATELTVGRGVLDTIPTAHLSGSVVFAWDYYGQGDAISYVDGEAVSVKLLARNDVGEVALATATASDLTFDSRAIRPFPPGKVQFNGEYFPDSATGDIVIIWAHRDRQQQTSGIFADFTDGHIGPEPGTTYTIRVYSDDTEGSLLRTVTGETDTTWAYTEAMEIADGGPFTDLRFEIEAVRDGYTSWQIINHTVSRAGYGLAYGYIYGGL
jgi:hypothetical protein